VPYPFTSREQYERSIRNPLGPDWNTAEVLAKNVAPAVSYKPGVIIAPIKLSSTEKAQLASSKRKERQQKATRRGLK
jgi:U3 small nucleolar RNA-associated protein 14